MTNDTVTILLAIAGALGAWTVSVIAAAFWLAGKFRELEKTIYREMEKHRQEDDRQFSDLRRRTQRLELNAFGFTHNP